MRQIDLIFSSRLYYFSDQAIYVKYLRCYCASEPLQVVRDRVLLLTPLGQCADQGLEIDPRGTNTLVTLDGEALTQKQRLSPDVLDRGVVLVLARRVALLLHHTELLTPSTQDHGLIGDSPAATIRCSCAAKPARVKSRRSSDPPSLGAPWHEPVHGTVNLPLHR